MNDSSADKTGPGLGDRRSMIKLGTMLGLLCGLFITVVCGWLWTASRSLNSRMAVVAGELDGPVLSGPAEGDKSGVYPYGLGARAYAFTRIAQVQLTSGNVERAIAALEQISDPSERDSAVNVFLNEWRQSSLFGEYPDAQHTPEVLVSQFREMVRAVDLLTDSARKAGFYARFAELRISFADRMPSDVEPTYDQLIESAIAMASQTTTASVFAANSSAGADNWRQVGVFGAITTVLTTAGGFVVSNLFVMFTTFASRSMERLERWLSRMAVLNSTKPVSGSTQAATK